MISDMDARVLEECIAAEQLLFKEQEKCRNELSTLTHLSWLRADERQMKCRNVQKAKVKNYIFGRLFKSTSCYREKLNYY